MRFKVVHLKDSDFTPENFPPFDINKYTRAIVIAPDERVFVVAPNGAHVEITWLGNMAPLVWLEIVAESILEEREKERKKLRAEELVKLAERFDTDDIIRLVKEGVI